MAGRQARREAGILVGILAGFLIDILFGFMAHLLAGIRLLEVRGGLPGRWCGRRSRHLFRHITGVAGLLSLPAWVLQDTQGFLFD